MPEHEVVEFCLQMTEVLELLAQQSPPLVHGLIRPEHVLVGRNSSQYYLTTFSVVLAGGGTQYVAGMERARLSPYASPEFVRGVADTRADLYSLIATAYYAVTGSVPSGGASGSIPSAQRINGGISTEFDTILMKGLRPIAGQRYQRPSELRQDLLALRSVSGSIVPGGERTSRPGGPMEYGRQASVPVTAGRQQPERVAQQQEAIPALPIKMVVDEPDEEQVVLLPKPEELPPMPKSNDQLNAVMLLSVVLIALIILVVLSQAL
jgi:serine/threonine protein kinase